MVTKTIYNKTYFLDFKGEFYNAVTSFLGKRRFNTSTALKTCFLRINGQNFMEHTFYDSLFTITVNGTYNDKIIRLKTRWDPGVHFEKAKYKTTVWSYYHVRDDAKYKVDHVTNMVFRGFLYSLFIQAAIDFRKVSANVAREIFEHSGIETEDFHICAIGLSTNSRLPLTESEFDGVANYHNAILNSKLLAKDFEVKNILQDNGKGKIESVLFTKRFSETELQKLFWELCQNDD